MEMSILALHGMLKTKKYDMTNSKSSNITTLEGGVKRKRLKPPKGKTNSIVKYLNQGIIRMYFVSTTSESKISEETKS